MPTFPSAEWLSQFCDAINKNTEHAVAAVSWEGDVTLVIEAEADKGVPHSVFAWLDLHRGLCRSAKIVSQDEGERARFVISAPYSRWKDVIKGNLDPVRGMREGRLRLQGDLPKIVEQLDAVKLLVNLAGSVETEFPDE